MSDELKSGLAIAGLLLGVAYMVWRLWANDSLE